MSAPNGSQMHLFEIQVFDLISEMLSGSQGITNVSRICP